MTEVVQVLFGIQDADNDKGSVLYYSVIDPYFTVLGGQYLDALKFYYQEVALRLDKIIMGKITSIKITIDCELPDGIKTVADIYSDVQEEALFSFPKQGASGHFQHHVPTFNHGIFGQKKKVFYTEDPDVEYYAALLFNSANAPDWTGEYGAITDYRGVEVTTPPTLTKKFGK